MGEEHKEKKKEEAMVGWSEVKWRLRYGGFIFGEKEKRFHEWREKMTPTTLVTLMIIATMVDDGTYNKDLVCG